MFPKAWNNWKFYELRIKFYICITIQKIYWQHLLKLSMYTTCNLASQVFGGISVYKSLPVFSLLGLIYLLSIYLSFHLSQMGIFTKRSINFYQNNLIHDFICNSTRLETNHISTRNRMTLCNTYIHKS